MFTYEENVDEFRNTTFPGEPQDSIDNVNGGGSKQLARQFLKRLFWSNVTLENLAAVNVETSPLQKIDK